MEYMKLHIKFLIFLGLWTLGGSKMKRHLYNIYYLSTFCFFGLFYIACELVTCFHDLNNFHKTLQNVAIFSFNGISIMRMIYWGVHFEKVQKFYQFFKSEELECRAFSLDMQNLNHLNVIKKLVRLSKKPSKHFTSYNQLQQFWKNKFDFGVEGSKNKLLQEQERIIRRANLLCFILVSNLCLVVVLDIIMLFTCYLFWGNFYEQKVLPYNLRLPLNLNNGNNYMIGWCYNILASMYVALGFCSVDFFMISVLIILESQVTAVSVAIEQIGQNLPHNIDGNIKDKLVDTQLTACVNNLQRILKCIQMLEDIFNIPCMIQYVLGTIIVCTILYILPEEESRFFQLTQVTFITMVLLEPLIMGWYSQSLTDQISNIKNSIYCIDWPDMSPKLRRKLYFNMLRFQRPVVLTLGKFTPINLQVFVTFVRRSYSFYTLIQKH